MYGFIIMPIKVQVVFFADTEKSIKSFMRNRISTFGSLPNRQNSVAKKNKEDIGKSFATLDFAVISWIWHQKFRQQKEKIDKLEFMKIKICALKGTIHLQNLLYRIFPVKYIHDWATRTTWLKMNPGQKRHFSKRRQYKWPESTWKGGHHF